MSEHGQAASPAARLASATARFEQALAAAGGVGRAGAAERTERRSGSVLEWRSFETAAGRRCYVLKALSAATPKGVGRMARDAAAAATLAAILRGRDELGVVCPEAFYEDLGVTVSPAIDAPSFVELAARRGRWWSGTGGAREVADTATRTGRWLRAVQDATPVPGGRFDVRAFVDYVQVRLDRLGQAPPPQGIATGLAVRVREALERHLAHVPAEYLGLAAAHGDFSLSNVLCEPARVVALDFTEYQEASTVLDPTRFLHQVEMMGLSPGYSTGTLDLVARAFLDGYGRPDLARHPLYVPFMVRHRVTHWLGRVKRASGLLARGTSLRTCLAHRRSLERDLSLLAA